VEGKIKGKEGAYRGKGGGNGMVRNEERWEW